MFVCYLLVSVCVASLAAGLRDGLVACYPFNGDARDVTGNGNDGEVNGATPTSDRFGNANSAYFFQGTVMPESNIKINSTNFNLATFTFSAWVSFIGGNGDPRVFSTSGFEIVPLGSGQLRQFRFNDTLGPGGSSVIDVTSSRLYPRTGGIKSWLSGGPKKCFSMSMENCRARRRSPPLRIIPGTDT